MAEGFLPFIDDNISIANTVFQQSWEEAREVDPARFLAADIQTQFNQNAGVFGEYDSPPVDPQTLISTATFPWSWYTCGVTMSYQQLRSIQGKNQRVDLIKAQVAAGIQAISQAAGTDLTNGPSTKGKNFGTGYNGLGIVEAADNGTIVNVYGGISRTGAGSFANWPGQGPIGSLLLTGLGNATNDPTWILFANLYNACSIGVEAPTCVYTHKKGVAAYMWLQQTLQRVAPMDTANIGFGGAMLFNAEMLADDHIPLLINAGKFGTNFYAINDNHTNFYYFGKKGFDYLDWIDTKDVIGRTARYVTVFQYVSTQPRLNGTIQNVNTLDNL